MFLTDFKSNLNISKEYFKENNLNFSILAMNYSKEKEVFENLLPEEQNKVLDFLQLVELEDLNEAASLLKKYNFDLAVRSSYDSIIKYFYLIS